MSSKEEGRQGNAEEWGDVRAENAGGGRRRPREKARDYNGWRLDEDGNWPEAQE